MATILRRIQHLEQRVATTTPAADASGAREILRAKIDRMAVALRASPDWTGELSANGQLTEVVHIDGSIDGFAKDDLERFIASFPIERV
jgi:hypothetical protein